ncbi:MAG: class I SAM-dependent methyltransferase [Vicinamibacterales bacterium]
MPAVADACALLLPTLRCPMCRSHMLASFDAVTCGRCRHRWSRPREGYLDLRVPTWNPGARRWQERQDETCRYYESLKTRPEEAVEGFRSDLQSFAPVLAKYRGSVLDIGGGHGIARAFMSSGIDYVSVDPSIEWLTDDWDGLLDDFPCLATPLPFVQAYAEGLPFGDASFDGAICLWTLNHCADPALALREIGRVVRTGGRFLLVVEDGEPTWSELASGNGEHYLLRSRMHVMAAKVAKPVRGWPTQRDHVAIGNRALDQWTTGGFSLRRRWWVGCYLALEYERRP